MNAWKAAVLLLAAFAFGRMDPLRSSSKPPGPPSAPLSPSVVVSEPESLRPACLPGARHEPEKIRMQGEEVARAIQTSGPDAEGGPSQPPCLREIATTADPVAALLSAPDPADVARSWTELENSQGTEQMLALIQEFETNEDPGRRGRILSFFLCATNSCFESVMADELQRQDSQVALYLARTLKDVVQLLPEVESTENPDAASNLDGSEEPRTL